MDTTELIRRYKAGERNFKGANLERAYLSGTNLEGINLRGAYLSKANLKQANLSEADLSEADLSEADLFRANLSGANLQHANLERANMKEANLNGANLEGSTLDIGDKKKRSRQAQAPSPTTVYESQPSMPVGLGAPISSSSMANQARNQFEQGKSLFEKNDYYTALACFDKFIQFNPNHAEGYAWRARVRNALGDETKCLEDINKAIQLDPSCSLVYYVRGKISDKKKDFAQSIVNYTRVIELDPSNADAYNNRGWVYKLQGDYTCAIADCTQSIELNPDEINAYINRGQCYRAQQDFTHAIPDLLRVNQDGNPDHWTAYQPETQNNNHWCQLAYQHFVNELLPKIRQASEIVLEYWPATFYWGEKERQRRDSDSEYTVRSQLAARGYLCISNAFTYIVLRKQITKKYRIERPGFLQNFFGVALYDEYNRVDVFEDDKIVSLSHSSLKGVELSDDIIILPTASDTWQIIPLFNGTEQYIQVALSMASNGKLNPTKVVKKQTLIQEVDKLASSPSIKASLKALDELKADGLISETEYKAKRKELLDRI